MKTKKSFFLIGLFFYFLPSSSACDCIEISFCELVNQQYFAIAFKGKVVDNVRYDNVNQDVAIYIEIEKLYSGDASVTDTVKLYGNVASSIACEFDVATRFPIGTEMVAAVGRSARPITNPDAAIENYWEVKTSPCIFINLQLSNGNVNGPLAPGLNQLSIDEFEENFDNCISINDDLEKIECATNKLLVFPNPTYNGNIQFISNFFGSSIDQINVYASDGKLVKIRNKLDNGFSNNISLSQLPKGIYVLEIISEDDLKCFRKILVL